jgi:predicted DNA-binding transcriptional regulator AlpA
MDASNDSFSLEKESSLPDLMDAERLAKALSVSLRTLYRLKGRGYLPDPIRLGGSVRWRSTDIQRWILAGCPKQQGVLDVDRDSSS